MNLWLSCKSLIDLYFILADLHTLDLVQIVVEHYLSTLLYGLEESDAFGYLLLTLLYKGAWSDKSLHTVGSELLEVVEDVPAVA